VDRAQLADFLRTRREALQPEDVGLPRGPRRRTHGLRREEVAALCGMSADYYTRIEQQRGPVPSEPMLAAIARGLRLTLDERDHLFRIAGHNTPSRALRTDHVATGMMRILDRLTDTPAQVISDLAETLVQTRLGVALVGDEMRFTGLSRSMLYRWFTDAETRAFHPEEDHDLHSRIYTSALRGAYSNQGPGSRAETIVTALLDESPSFPAYWERHEVGVQWPDTKRMLHPQLGLLHVHCHKLVEPDQGQQLLVYTATPGTETYEKFQLLSAVSDLQAPDRN
jgi:transcriptional regulator with XRE-family HTH domain